MRVKLFLVIFGVLLGGLLLEISTRLLLPLLRPSGTTYESVDDLRHAILSSPGGSSPRNANDAPREDRANLRDLVEAHPDERIIFDLRPHLDVTFQRAQVQTNSCGMRGPERRILKSLSTYRIAMLGDSFAFGWGVEANETFVARLEQNLNRIADGALLVEVLNFGVPGYSTFQEVALFKERGILFDPDEVVVFFVQNDFDMPFFVRDIGASSGILASSEFLRLGLQALRPELASKVEQQRLALKGYDPSSALTELSDLTRARGVRLSLAINPRKEWREWRDRIPVLRERRDIRVFNLRSDFMRLINGRQIPTENLTLSFDPHPSPLRHALYGDLMTPYFMDRITPRLTTPRIVSEDA